MGEEEEKKHSGTGTWDWGEKKGKFHTGGRGEKKAAFWEKSWNWRILELFGTLKLISLSWAGTLSTILDAPMDRDTSRDGIHRDGIHRDGINNLSGQKKKK